MCTVSKGRILLLCGTSAARAARAGAGASCPQCPPTPLHRVALLRFMIPASPVPAPVPAPAAMLSNKPLCCGPRPRPRPPLPPAPAHPVSSQEAFLRGLASGSIGAEGPHELGRLQAEAEALEADITR